MDHRRPMLPDEASDEPNDMLRTELGRAYGSGLERLPEEHSRHTLPQCHGFLDEAALAIQVFAKRSELEIEIVEFTNRIHSRWSRTFLAQQAQQTAERRWVRVSALPPTQSIAPELSHDLFVEIRNA